MRGELSRRAFGALLGSAALAGCVTTPRPGVPRLPRATISPELIDRVTVGLRPFRAPGFVVRGEALGGGKRLVHNYGHGGGGISLSWGSSELAVHLAAPQPGERAAVLGCGIMGLTSARILQERGAQVTIYARELPPYTTSNMAGGQWWPASVFDGSAAEPAFLAQFEWAARRAWARFGAMIDRPGYGVWWQDNWNLRESPFPASRVTQMLADLDPGMAYLGPGEHPFSVSHVLYQRTPMIEPNTHLAALMRDFQAAGGRIVQQAFHGPEDIAALPYPLVVNCTGLGSRELFGDTELLPVRGQLVVLKPQPQVDYNLLWDGYAFPRPDGLVLGGTHQRGDERLEVDDGDTARILAMNVRTFATVE